MTSTRADDVNEKSIKDVADFILFLKELYRRSRSLEFSFSCCSSWRVAGKTMNNIFAWNTHPRIKSCLCLGDHHSLKTRSPAMLNLVQKCHMRQLKSYAPEKGCSPISFSSPVLLSWFQYWTKERSHTLPSWPACSQSKSVNNSRTSVWYNRYIDSAYWFQGS